VQAASSGRRRQYLLFAVGDIRCYLELTRLDSVVPWATLLAAEEHGVAGWLEYRGGRVPVFDLAQEILGEPTLRTLGSRILLLECNGKHLGALASEAFSIGDEDDVTASSMERLDPCEVLTAALSRLP
ncbi:MAG: chemotaxis protein CheW, partial [Terriglobus sp.]